MISTAMLFLFTANIPHISSLVTVGLLCGNLACSLKENQLARLSFSSLTIVLYLHCLFAFDYFNLPQNAYFAIKSTKMHNYLNYTYYKNILKLLNAAGCRIVLNFINRSIFDLYACLQYKYVSQRYTNELLLLYIWLLNYCLHNLLIYVTD